MTATSARHGFTLVELIVVLAIISLLALLAVGMAGTLQGSLLSQAAAELSGYLKEAHQMALTDNRKVEIRFYQYADPSFAGEVTGTPATGKFRALWLFEIDDKGNYTVAAHPLLLPRGVIVDSGISGSAQSLSTLLDPSLNPIALSNSGSAATDAAHPFPGKVSSQYLGYHYERDGTTDLGIGSNWFFTIHAVTLGDALGVAPKNYATLRIDPVNGSVTTFRP